MNMRKRVKNSLLSSDYTVLFRNILSIGKTTMKLNQRLVIALFAASTGIFGFGSVASAGEGGAAAAAGFTLNDGKVTGAAVGAAVGKQNAGATATNYGTINTAGAAGSAGNVTVTTNGTATPGSTITTTSESGLSLLFEQKNGLENKVEAPSSFQLDQDN